jgi:hypothetical protein
VAVRALWLLLALPALAPVVAAAEAAAPIRLEAAVDRDHVTIDQRIRLTLQIEVPHGARVSWPELPPRLGGFAVVAAAALDMPAEANRLAYSWLLEPERIGDLSVPPLPVRVQEAGVSAARATEVQSPEVPVTVISLLPEDVDIALHKDIAPPVTLGASGGAGLLWLGLALLAGGLLFLLRRWQRHRRRAAAPARGLLPADLEALAELDRLQALRADDDHAIETYYLRLSAILRHYLERRFALAALSRTTEEVVAGARRAAGEVSAQGERIAALLGPCDLVKFARHRPAPGERGEALAQARAFITGAGGDERMTAADRGSAPP